MTDAPPRAEECAGLVHLVTKRYGLVLFGLLVIALALVVPVSAAVTIDSTGGDDSALIAGAITSAAATDHVVILNPGTYYAHDIIVGNSVTIRANTSYGGTAVNTIIDAQNAGTIFDNTGAHSLAIDTLTLQHGRSLYGGAIYSNGGTVTITGSTITGCSAMVEGGAIYSVGGTVTITGSTFTSCSASADGGAIFSSGTLIITSSTITGCTAGYGSAIFSNGGTVTITDSTITGCSAGYGGAIYSTWGSTVIVDSSQITGCTAHNSGGVIRSGNGGTVTIRNGSVISGCTAGTDGGAIWSDGAVTVQDSEISHCTAANNGGAIYLTTGGSLTAHGATFDTDTATNAAGGAIYAVTGTHVTIDQNSVFTGCTAHNSGGAIEAFGTTDITDTTFTGCTAVTGGGAIENSGALTLDTVTFSNCQATGGSGSGGAIASGGSGTLTVTSSTFSGCSATTSGGAIYNGGTFTVSSSTMNGCSATDGGAIDNHGTSMITSSTLTGCSASNNGGAILSSGPLTVTSSTFTGNAAGAIGSAIYSTGSGSSVHFSRFYQNLHPVWGVVHSPTSLEAQNNWWGTNNTPPTPGYVNENPWLVLGATASPASITMAQTAAITANLTYDSGNGYHNPASGHVPDGIPVAFSLSGVSGTLGPLQGNVSTGSNATLFTPASGGTAHITATIDGETVTIDIPVTGVVPAISSITPSSGVNTSPVSITDLHGTGFWTAGTTTVNLTRAGHANITTTTTALSTTQITCTLPITGAEAGRWDVVVVNPDGQEGVLADGFTIIAGVPTTVPTAAPPYTGQDTSGTLSDFPSGGSVSPTLMQAGALPLMTVTVNIGGDSKAWQAIVTGTQLSGLIVTGTVQHDSGSNMTAPPGIVYQYINLVPARYTSITRAVVNFTVPQAWLDENHIAPGSIVLYHQTANGWEALPTTVLYTKDGTVYFSSESNSFSLFAIAGISTVTTPATISTMQGIMSAMVQTPAPAAVAKAPVTTQTTAPPAATPQPAAPSPLLNIVPVIAAIGVLAGGGFMVRRWWIRRQNPALFREND